MAAPGGVRFFVFLESHVLELAIEKDRQHRSRLVGPVEDATLEGLQRGSDRHSVGGVPPCFFERIQQFSTAAQKDETYRRHGRSVQLG